MLYYIPHTEVSICNSHILQDLNSNLLTIIYVRMTNSEQKELLSPFWNFCILHRITENRKDYCAENRVDPLLALVYQKKEVFFWTVFWPCKCLKWFKKINVILKHKAHNQIYRIRENSQCFYSSFMSLKKLDFLKWAFFS